MLAKLMKPRKKTSHAKIRTKRKRTHLLSTIRTNIAGTSKDSSIAQHASGSNYVELEHRHEILYSP